MKKFLNVKGYTLAEVTVAAGLIGVVAVGVTMGLGTLSKSKKRVDASSKSAQYLSIMLNKIQPYTKGVSWQGLDYESTYQLQHDLKLKKVGWGLSDITTISTHNDLKLSIDVPDHGGNHFYYRDAHTLYKTMKSKKSIMFSRCVDKNDFTNDFTVSSALALGRVPFLVSENNKTFIYCCPRGSANLCGGSNKVSGENSKWRVLSFELKQNGSWTVRPSINDRDKIILGVGHVSYVTKFLRPSAMKSYVFTINNSCYGRANSNDEDAACRNDSSIKVKVVNSEVKSNSVHNSGFMTIQ